MTFLAWDDLEDFWPRLEAQVLAPLFAGHPIRYQVPDWENDTFGRGLGAWRDAPFRNVVVLEGVGASRRALSGRLHFCVWIDTPADLRLQRGLQRDAALEGSRELWQRWVTREQAFFAADGARARADVIVDGTVSHERGVITTRAARH